MPDATANCAMQRSASTMRMGTRRRSRKDKGSAMRWWESISRASAVSWRMGVKGKTRLSDAMESLTEDGQGDCYSGCSGKGWHMSGGMYLGLNPRVGLFQARVKGGRGGPTELLTDQTIVGIPAAHTKRTVDVADRHAFA